MATDELKGRIVGCIDPFSLAEEVEGKRINWSDCKDEFETLANCFGITKEGFLSSENPIMLPYFSADSQGKLQILNVRDASRRMSDFLRKYQLPTPASDIHTRTLRKDDTLSVKQARTLNVLFGSHTRMLRTRSLAKPGGSDPSSLYTWKDKGYFFNEFPHWSDVAQNSIGDCYFLAALASVAFVNPFLIQNCAGMRSLLDDQRHSHDYPDSPWHRITFYVPDGTYESSRAWKDQLKTVQPIYVSEDVLVSRQTGKNFGVCGAKEKQGILPAEKEDADPCWAAVYEKAYAAFLNRECSDQPSMEDNNAPIWGGRPEAALKELLHTENVSSVDLADLTPDDIWDYSLRAPSFPTCATIYSYPHSDGTSDGKAGSEKYYLSMGLYIGHVYSVFGHYRINGKRYIALRNPHGRNLGALKNNPEVFHGDWGFNMGYHVEMTYYPGIALREVGGCDDTQLSKGTFLMELHEFQRVFDEITFTNYNVLSETQPGKFYYVNRNAQDNGDHEIHKEGCSELRISRHMRPLGIFASDKEALKAARKLYPKANGCSRCCPLIDTD